MKRSASPILLVMLATVAYPSAVFAQAAWEFSPYEAKVWLAATPAPEVPARMVASLNDALSARMAVVFGAVLRIDVAAAPPLLQARLLYNLEELTAESVAAAADRRDLELDKIFLVSLDCDEGRLVVRARQLDCRSRQLGPVILRYCGTAAELPLAVSDGITESFTPLARIEQVDERKMTARLRAGGLIVDPLSPALVEPGMVLRPVLRRNDRTGQPLKGGIQAIGWTFLSVDERRGSILECSLQSGFRAAIPPRGGARTERLALLVKPVHAATRLVLRSRSEPAKTLSGYEIYRRDSEEGEPQLLGTTDRDGEFVVSRGDDSLQTLIVKNGKQPLARLPLVPGCEETLIASIVDDDGRLAAEGFVAALQSRVLDLVARREILAAQIRARVKEGKADDAQRLLDDFRRLDSRADLNRDLDRFRQQVSTGDKATQERIDRVFADAQRLLLLKPLSDDLLAQLTREVAAIRAAGE